MIRNARTILVFLALAMSFIVVGMKLFFLQVWHHDELNRQVQKLTYREKPEMSSRGMILDKNGKILAMSVKSYTLFVDPTRIEDAGELKNVFSKAGITLPENVLNHSAKTSYVVVKENLSQEKMQEIKSMELQGVGFVPSQERTYPEGKMACHVLGLVGHDGKGLEGVELVYNDYLTGKKVKAAKYRDGRGREMSDKMIDPDNLRGADIYLTIDRNIQFIAEQEIDKAWRDSRAKKAVVIVQDPNTGEILAIASRPGYEPGDSAGNSASLRNPAICDTVEPGSTFKLVTAAAALEEKAVTTTENIWCEDGKYSIYNHTISDHEKRGFLTLAGIMEYSSNIGMAKVGQRLGKEKLFQYIKQFGFDSLTGIDLPGEARGLLRPPDKWSGLSVPIISFGQEIGATAIQVINAYSAVVNGGSLLAPKVVKEIKNSDGAIVYSEEKSVIRRVVKPETAALLRGMLVNVVENGTGVQAKVPGYSVGGKTGTAQKRDPLTGKYSSSKYVASFCGAIPMSNPRLTILVMLDEPQGDYWAASRAAPVFSKIASRSMRYLQVSPDREPVNLCDIKRFARK